MGSSKILLLVLCVIFLVESRTTSNREDYSDGWHNELLDEDWNIEKSTSELTGEEKTQLVNNRWQCGQCDLGDLVLQYAETTSIHLLSPSPLQHKMGLILDEEPSCITLHSDNSGIAVQVSGAGCARAGETTITVTSHEDQRGSGPVTVQLRVYSH